MGKDLLKDIELNLAEKLIEDYEKIKGKITETRKKWIE